MAQDYAASVLGSVVRVSRLTAAGTTATGASATYNQKAFIRASFTPEYDDGAEILERNAAGEICVLYEAPTTLKRVSLEVTICNPDPEFSEILCGGTLLSSGGQSVGWAAPLTGVDATPNGTSVEVWSYAIVNGQKAAVNQFWHWVFPFTQLRPNGERAVENGNMASVFSGFGYGNAAWGDGPANDWPFTSDRAYAYARAATAPSVTGYATGL